MCAGFLAACVLVDLVDLVVDVLLCSGVFFMLESPAAIGAAAGAEADWAKAPKLTAEAMTAAMRVFMGGPLVIG